MQPMDDYHSQQNASMQRSGLVQSGNPVDIPAVSSVEMALGVLPLKKIPSSRFNMLKRQNNKQGHWLLDNFCKGRELEAAARIFSSNR